MNALDTAGTERRPFGPPGDRRTPGGGGDVLYTLRRSGNRPLSFRGRHVGFATGYRAAALLWHELNLYESEDGRFVTDIRVFGGGQRSIDQYYVVAVDRLEEAIAVFEAYDVRFDVPIDFDPADPSLAPSDLAVHAAALKCGIAEAVSQYDAVLAAFLYQIGHG